MLASIYQLITYIYKIVHIFLAHFSIVVTKKSLDTLLNICIKQRQQKIAAASRQKVSMYYTFSHSFFLPLLSGDSVTFDLVNTVSGIKYKLFLCSVYASSSIFYSIRFYSYSYLTIIHSFYL